jgi:hypothetical protein
MLQTTRFGGKAIRPILRHGNTADAARGEMSERVRDPLPGGMA